MNAYDTLVSKSTVPIGDAWVHLNNQRTEGIINVVDGWKIQMVAVSPWAALRRLSVRASMSVVEQRVDVKRVEYNSDAN